jgi:hypothetical protein
MATTNESGIATYTATAAAIDAGLRVRVNSAGLILVADAADASIGVTIEDIVASGTGAVKLFSAPGTFFLKTGTGGTTAGTATTALAGGLIGTGGTAILLMPLETVTIGGVAECARTV